MLKYDIPPRFMMLRGLFRSIHYHVLSVSSPVAWLGRARWLEGAMASNVVYISFLHLCFYLSVGFSFEVARRCDQAYD